MPKIQTFKQALLYLDQFIPKGRDFKFPGELGLARTAYLLSLMDNPQNKLKVIHIAGTSGKGSTAFLTSVILRSQGFKVGLSVSPILIDIRERFQIDNKLISQADFCTYLDEITVFIEQVASSSYGAPSYFEILSALTYHILYREGVDYAVIETGLGGLLDGTNVVTSRDKIAVITQIGLDHTSILGNTLAKIAYQKSGIIHNHNSVFTYEQNKSVIKVITQYAIKKEAKLAVIGKSNISNIRLLPSPSFDFSYMGTTIADIHLNMLGSFQVQNCALALAAAVQLSRRDGFMLENSHIKLALRSAAFPGRMQLTRAHFISLAISIPPSKNWRINK